MKFTTLLCASLFFCACGGSTPPATTAGDAPAAPAPATPAPAPATSDALTAADCEAKGGSVVGDIGDGAIHKPGYVCPESGKPPLGSISAEPGGPIATEGAVCCGPK